jgi:hypothetical protein
MPDLLAPPWSQYKGTFTIILGDGNTMEVEGVRIGTIGVHVEMCGCEFPTAMLTHLGTGLRLAEVESSWDKACRVAALINRDCKGFETQERAAARQAFLEWSKGASPQAIIDSLCSTHEVFLP